VDHSDRLRIVVTGLAATYPYGGVFWDYLQYPLGLAQLGHDVLYLEDTGQWCYDPLGVTFVQDGGRNAALLARRLAAYMPELGRRWCFRDARGVWYGRSAEQVERYCADADLFVHLSASCWMREEYFAAARTVFIDSDPMYTQESVPGYVAGTVDAATRSRVDALRRHDLFFTYAENIGAPDCRVPTALFHWLPTRQPIVLDRFTPYRVGVWQRRPVLTTVGSWEPATRVPGPVVDGVAYGGKGTEFRRFVDVPARSPVPVYAALNGHAPAHLLRRGGWHLENPNAVSDSPGAYRSYLATSLGEFSVAKHAYVASRSGWFSGRTACYLALGVPAVVQDTGFGRAIPSGAGVLSFTTVPEAHEAISSLVADPRAHAETALEIATTYFDAHVVLGQLIERAFAESPRRAAVTPVQTPHQ
jgi:hypothetical protein